MKSRIIKKVLLVSTVISLILLCNLGVARAGVILTLQDIEPGAGGSQTIGAFGVVWVPQPPYPFVPIPYGNISAEDDTSKGTTKHKTEIGGKKDDNNASVTVDYSAFLSSAEEATLTIYLAAPSTGLSLGSAYKTTIGDEPTDDEEFDGQIIFDLTDLSIAYYKIVFELETIILPSSPLISDFDTEITLAGSSYAIAPVPEPATMLLFGTGLAGLIGIRRRKKA